MFFQCLLILSSIFWVKKFVYLLQQNGYKPILFCKNLGILKWFVICDLMTIAYLFLPTIDFEYIFLLLALQNVLLSFCFRPKKIKLKYTKRVQRFMLLFCILTTVYVLSLPYNYCYVFNLFLYLIFGVTYYCALPFERLIKQSYIKKAKAKLASQNTKVIAITGSYGKTTTKNILYSLLKDHYITQTTPKNYNTDMGVCKAILEDLKSNCEYFICEMGAKKRGDIEQICKIVNPDYAIITGITYCHLAEFKTLENIKRTKFELLEHTKNFAVIHLDGEADELFNDAEIEKYSVGSRGKNADFVYESKKGNEFTVEYLGESFLFDSNLCGEHIKQDACLGIAMANLLGISFDKIAVSLKKLEPVANRLQVVKINGITILDNSYNSNPKSIQNSLAMLSNLKGRKIAIICGMVELGCEQQKQNRILGESCKFVCDYVFVVGRTNRDAILEGLGTFENVVCFDSLSKLQDFLPKFIRAGDCILFENDLPDNYR